MSARYSTISGLLGFVEHSGNSAASQMDIEILPEPSPPVRTTRKRDSLRKISVRHLVSKIETRAAETLERNFGGRFSGRLRKEKRLADESGAAGSASTSAEAPTTSTARSWYMVHLSPDKRSNLTSNGTASAVSLSSSVATDEDDHNEHVGGGGDDIQQGVIGRDKISADSGDFSQRLPSGEIANGNERSMKTAPGTPTIDREDSGRWSICSDFEKDSLPDVENVCDTWNEFIYLRLSEENVKHLNSYSPDFETTPFDEFYQPAEASNTIISLRFTPTDLHRILHGYDLTNVSEDEDDVQSHSSRTSYDSDGVFEDARIQAFTEPRTTPSEDSLDEGVVFRDSPLESPEPHLHPSDIDM